MLYCVLVDGKFVTAQNGNSNGMHLPVLSDEITYAKLFQTRNGAVSCFNKLNAVIPECVIEVHELNVKLSGLFRTNETD